MLALTRRGIFSKRSWEDTSSGTREKLESIANAREYVLTACSDAPSCYIPRVDLSPLSSHT